MTWKGGTEAARKRYRATEKYKMTARLYARKWERKLRQLILDVVGRKCARCGFADERALQIDHINGGGAKEIRDLGGTHRHYRKVLQLNGAGYQTLCANCNWIKKAERNEI